MKTVLIPPIVNWGFLKQLPQQIAEQFSLNGYKVLYCNVSPVFQGVKKINDNLTIYGDYKTCLDEIKKKRIKIDIIYNTAAKNFEIIDTIKPKLSIYHSCDMFVEWENYELEMIKRADIVLCTSNKIYKTRKKEHHNVHLLRNGCNDSMVNSYKIDYSKIKDIMDIESPIAIFCGAIGVWVNTFLLKKTASMCNTVLVGSEFGKERPSGIINLGVKEHDELVNYYSYCTFGLLPFNIKSDIALAANPIKLWEYLACGLPVVAMGWEETELEEFEGVVFTSKTKDGFIENVKMILNLSKEELEQISEKAKAIAKNNTWEKRFETINTLIERG